MPADFAEVARQWAEATTADLGGLLGAPVALTPGGETCGPRPVLLGEGGNRVVAVLRTKDEDREPLYLVVPHTSAEALAEARLGHPPEGGGDGFAGEARDAFVETAELCAGVLGRVLSEAGIGPGLEHEVAAALPSPPPEDAILPAGDYRGRAFVLALGGEACGELLLLVPAGCAERWFGPAASGGAAEGLPIAVIDPDPARRAGAEALSEALGREVWTLDAAELGPNSLDELRETGAVILAWDLGGVVGLDLLDVLRRDPRTAGLRVALATEAPTRESVLTALRWGAATVLHQPLVAEEVARRLLETAPEGD